MVDPFIEDQIDNWVGDFVASDRLNEYPPPVRDAAGGLLGAFLRGACESAEAGPDDLEEADVRAGLLEGVGPLAVSEGVREHVPELCAAFLTDLEERGRLGGGRALGAYARALRQAFAQLTRPQPITRAGSKLNRNDPCPCGSGKKYKKCCME